MGEDPQVSEEIGRSPIGAALEAAERLLAAAEADAADVRAAAERDAGLLIAKARRVLEAAEARASVIVATARAAAVEPAVVDLRSDVDLTPPAPRPALRIGASRFDEMLASAIESAVDDAFPAHRAPQLTD